MLKVGKPKSLRQGIMVTSATTDDDDEEIAKISLEDRVMEIHMHNILKIQKLANWLLQYCAWREKKGR